LYRLCTGCTAHRESRGIGPLFHDHGTRRGLGVSVMPRPLFTPGKDPVPIVQEAGWAPGLVWAGAKNLTPTGIWSPDRPAHSQSLCWLRYPAHVRKKALVEFVSLLFRTQLKPLFQNVLQCGHHKLLNVDTVWKPMAFQCSLQFWEQSMSHEDKSGEYHWWSNLIINFWSKTPKQCDHHKQEQCHTARSKHQVEAGSSLMTPVALPIFPSNNVRSLFKLVQETQMNNALMSKELISTVFT